MFDAGYPLCIRSVTFSSIVNGFIQWQSCTSRQVTKGVPSKSGSARRDSSCTNWQGDRRRILLHFAMVISRPFALRCDGIRQLLWRVHSLLLIRIFKEWSVAHD